MATKTKQKLGGPGATFWVRADYYSIYINEFCSIL